MSQFVGLCWGGEASTLVVARAGLFTILSHMSFEQPWNRTIVSRNFQRLLKPSENLFGPLFAICLLWTPMVG